MKLKIDIEQEWYERACKATMSLDGALPIYQSIKEGTPYEERPRGEWVKEYLQIDEHHFRSYAKCKVCGCSFKPYSFAVKEFDFCPKCGVDMRKKEGEEK